MPTPTFKDLVQETSTTTGTGTYDLDGSAPTGKRSFIAAGLDTETVTYLVTDGVDWEINEGVVAAGSPPTLTRGTLLDSSTGSAIDWPGGTLRVGLVLTSRDIATALAGVGGGGGLPFPLSAPASPSAFDEEFTGASLDAKWTVMNSMTASGSTIQYNFDGTWLLIPMVANSTETARRYRIRQTISGIPAATEFTMVARIALASFPSLNAAITLSWGDNAAYNTGNACLVRLDVDSTNFRIGAYTVGFTEVTANIPLGASQVYIGFRRDEDNIFDCFWSLDGIGWRLLWGASTRNYAFTNLFLDMNGATSGNTVSMMGVDFIRVNDARFYLPRND
jgi:hypothetical protein